MDECKHELWTFPTLPVGICCECRKTEREIGLEAKVERLEKAQKEAYGAGWEDGRNSTSVTGDWTFEYEAWAALEGKQE